MDENDTSPMLVRWTSLASQGLNAFLQICQPVLRSDACFEPQTQFVLNTLGLSCHTSSESALLPASFSRVWDAEILIRSVLEGTAKYLFLCTKDSATRATRIEEYWNILPEFDRLKRHDRITQFLSVLGELGPSGDALRELLLTEKEVVNIRAAYPRKERQALAQKWSFNDVIRAIALESNEAAGMLANAYGLASNIVHQDGDGVGMIGERARRSQERRELVEIAHAGRQVTDLLTFAMIRALHTLQLANQDTEPVHSCWQTQQPLREELAAATVSWWDVEGNY